MPWAPREQSDTELLFGARGRSESAQANSTSTVVHTQSRLPARREGFLRSRRRATRLVHFENHASSRIGRSVAWTPPGTFRPRRRAHARSNCAQRAHASDARHPHDSFCEPTQVFTPVARGADAPSAFGEKQIGVLNGRHCTVRTPSPSRPLGHGRNREPSDHANRDVPPFMAHRSACQNTKLDLTNLTPALVPTHVATTRNAPTHARCAHSLGSFR